MKRILPACLLSLLLTPTTPELRGAEADTGGGLIRIRCLAWSEDQQQQLFVQTGEGEYEALELRSNRRSPSYEVKNAGGVRVYAEARDAEGNTVKVPVLTVPIPENIKEPMVVLFEGKKDGEPIYRGMVVEDAEEDFPFGSYRVMNFTGFPVAFELDGKTHPITSRAALRVSPDSNERKNIAVRIHVLLDGEVHLIRQSFWRHQPDQRMLVFVLQNPDPDRPEFVLRTVSERQAVYDRLHEAFRSEETR